MAERNNKGGADTRGEMTTTGQNSPRDELDNRGINQLQQGLDDLRSSVASLTARLAESTAVGGRGLQQAYQMAGDVAEDVVDRAAEGVAAVRSRVQDQSPAVIGLAFLAGVILGGLIGASSIGRQPNSLGRRHGRRR
jgi:hypothetical protein